MKILRRLLKAVVVLGFVALAVTILNQKGYFLVWRDGLKAKTAFVQRYQTLAERRKANAYLNYLYGLLHEHREEHEDAALRFRAAKAYDPESVLSRVHLGVNLVHLGRKDEAAREFEQTSKLTPLDP